MNKTVILLSAVSLALIAALVMRSQHAAAQLEAAQQETLSVSNQLSEARMKVNHQERLAAALQSQLDERDGSIASLSYTVTQLRTSLAGARSQLESSRAALPPVVERANAFAAERDGFSNRVNAVEAMLRDQEKQLGQARARAVAVESELAALSHRLADDQADRARWDALLTDPEALQIRLTEARRNAAAPRSPLPAKTPDWRQPLILQPDGTVAFVPDSHPDGD